MNLNHEADDRQLALLGASNILTRGDLSQLCESEVRIYELMKDGRWHTPEQIELAAGQNGNPAREGLRRMRELRRIGCAIKHRRVAGLRQFQYRLTKGI